MSECIEVKKVPHPVVIRERHIINTSSSKIMISSVPPWISFAATLLSGGVIAYIIRQIWTGIKLKRAIKAEISSMRGLKNCSDSMAARGSSPSSSDITPSEVPPAGTIPTIIYEANVSRIGVLRWKYLSRVVKFYSDTLHYKSIINAIRSEEEVPEADQRDLYNSIGELEEKRQSLFGKGWLDD